MSRTRLDLTALRTSHLPRPPDESPTLSRLVASDGSLTVSRRQMLGLAGAAAVTLPPLAKSLTSALLGRVEILDSPGRVVFKLAGRERWVIDARRFAGAPRLQVDKTEGHVRISLSGARFPGTDLSADLLCDLRRGLGGWKLHLELAAGGLRAEAPLESWLAGREPLQGTVNLPALAVGLGDTVRLAVEGRAQAQFHPTWRLSLTGAHLGRLHGLGEDLFSDAVDLYLLTPDQPSLLTRPPARRTLVSLQRGKHSWRLDPGLTAPGRGQIVSSQDAFDTLRVELGETATGQRRAALLAEGGAQQARLAYQPQGEMRGNDNAPFTLPLEHPRLALTFDSGRAERALVADFAAEPVWLHTGGCSLQLGQGEGAPPFELYAAGDAFRAWRCEPALLTVAAALPEALVEPTAAPAGSRIAFVSDDPRLAQVRIPAPVPRVPLPAPQPQPEEAEEEQPATSTPATIRVPAGEVTVGPVLHPGILALLPARITVVRPEDLLNLTFELRNLRLVTGDTEPARLEKVNAQNPAYLIVHFPPQHITERAFWEVDPNYTVEGQPGVGSEPPTAPPVPSRIAGPSRLAFRLPADMARMPYTLGALMDWKRYEMSVAATAQPPPSLVIDQWRPRGRFLGPLLPLPEMIMPGTGAAPTVRQLRIAPQAPTTAPVTAPAPARTPTAVRATPTVEAVFDPAILSAITPLGVTEPTAEQTAIEAPWHLILSPHGDAGWAHAITPATNEGRTELWHTRLAIKTADGRIDERNAYYRTLRAIWSPDYQKDALPPKPDPPPPFRMSLDPNDRCQLVWLTGDPSIRQYINRYVRAERFMLSPLGAWIDTNYAAGIPPAADSRNVQLSIEAWRHQATMGRDQYVRVVYAGYLFPFGHRASLVKVTERKFAPGPGGGSVAYMFQRAFIVVREPIKGFGTSGLSDDNKSVDKQMPFVRVEITSLVTPNLDAPQGVISPQTAWEAFWANVGGRGFPFHMVGEDADGNLSEFTAPLIWVSVTRSDTAANMTAVRNAYHGSDNSLRSLEGQQVAFADPQTMGDTVLDTQSMTFGAFVPAQGVALPVAQPRFYPLMREAEVRIPAVEAMLGAGKQPTIIFGEAYLKNPDNSAANQGKVFAALKGAAEKVGFPGDKSGGLATPDFGLSGLSGEYGAIGGNPEDFAQGIFDPTKFLDAGAKLFGTIPLVDIIEGLFEKGKVPGLTTEFEKDDNGLPKAITVKYEWKPKVKDFPSSGLPILKVNANTTMVITATLKADLRGGEPSAKVEGKLEKFALNLIPIAGYEYFVQLVFKSISFVSDGIKKPDFKVSFDTLKFGGPLDFIKKLMDMIPMDGFAAAPALDITGSGLKLGFSLPIPGVGVGVFSLTNIKLGASFEVPFTGDPIKVRFNLSERNNPFCMSVSIFGGGGFFAMVLSLRGIESVEASFEFGGAFAMDIGVASGGVKIMAGVYFKYTSDEGVELEGYLRCSGSLNILGLITISVEFYLGLKYLSQGNQVWGRASLKVSIEILFFSISVTLSVERKFAGSSSSAQLDGARLAQLPADDRLAQQSGQLPAPALWTPLRPPSPGDLMTAGDWRSYCEAFA